MTSVTQNEITLTKDATSVASHEPMISGSDSQGLQQSTASQSQSVPHRHSLKDANYSKRLARRHVVGRLFEWTCRVITWASLGILSILLISIGWQAWGWLDLGFFSRGNSYLAREAGIMAGLWGSIWLIVLTAFMSIPLGVGAAVYLEEYAKPTRLTKLIQLNISNLAGVPSIVYGILGFTVFVRMFGLRDRPEKFILSLGFCNINFELPLGRVVLSGAATLTLLSLPVVIIASQEALRSIPASLRHASLALGATKWQTIRHQVLPAAMPGILTGVILAMSRALGETAPLAVLGAAAQLSVVPGRIKGFGDLMQQPGKLAQAPFDQFTAIPLQIYSWVSDPSRDFEHVAAAGIVVLLTVLITMNGTAIFIRQRFQKKIRW